MHIGLVVAAYGKRYDVEIELNGIKQTLNCVTRGKKTNVAAGDIVDIKQTADNSGVIESIQERKSLLFRSNAYKTKTLAANVTQAIIVLATQPSFYEELLNRCLIACEQAQIKPLILLNKSDLDNPEATQKLAFYAKLGYDTLTLSAKQSIEALLPYLQNHSSILVGQSGMGKSTIVNALVPQAQVRTQEMSHALDSGKHTTTATHLYHLNEASNIIDAPGLQEFGLQHVKNCELDHHFIEFRPYLGKCRYNNCMHMSEPNCAIREQIPEKISEERIKYYELFHHEITTSK